LKRLRDGGIDDAAQALHAEGASWSWCSREPRSRRAPPNSGVLLALIDADALEHAARLAEAAH
jgi:hypothetical protein